MIRKIGLALSIALAPLAIGAAVGLFASQQASEPAHGSSASDPSSAAGDPAGP